MNRLLVFTLVLLLTLSAVPALKAADSELKLPPYKKTKLPNGMTVLLMEQHETPIVSFNFLLTAGSVADPAGKDGLASVTAELLRKGTRTRTADQISAELDYIGGQLGASATFDHTVGSAEFIKKDLTKGLELFGDVILNAQFPAEEVSKLLKQRIDRVKAAKDEARTVIGSYFNAHLYRQHPYGRPSGGDETSLSAITRQDVQGFYQKYYSPGNAILAVVGDFVTADMERMLKERFGGWTPHSGAQKLAPGANLSNMAPFIGKKLLLIDKPDSTQTFFQIGNLGIDRKNPDRVYIQIINTLFGGRFTSMLNTELRIKSGLSYGARSSFSERLVRGPFSISTFTRNETTEKAIDLTLDVLRRLHEKGITDEELQSAKTYLKGQFGPTIETTDQLAALIAQLEFYGLDQTEVDNLNARIDSMTIADAQRVIKQYFPLDNLVFVLIGKASEIDKIARKYASTVETRSISRPGF